VRVDMVGQEYGQSDIQSELLTVQADPPRRVREVSMMLFAPRAQRLLVVAHGEGRRQSLPLALEGSCDGWTRVTLPLDEPCEIETLEFLVSGLLPPDEDEGNLYIDDLRLIE
ncbi:unnamed protein product, partial [marine sediment metagenome]